jgi:hypothetical protein
VSDLALNKEVGAIKQTIVFIHFTVDALSRSESRVMSRLIRSWDS